MLGLLWCSGDKDMSTMHAFHVPDVTMGEILHWFDYMRKHYGCETNVLIAPSEGKSGHALLRIDGYVRCGDMGHRVVYCKAEGEYRETSLPSLLRDIYDLFFEFCEAADGCCPECQARTMMNW